jgi:hypothetical protein
MQMSEKATVSTDVKRTNGRAIIKGEKFSFLSLISFPDNLSLCPSVARSNVLPEKEKCHQLIDFIFIDLILTDFILTDTVFIDTTQFSPTQLSPLEFSKTQFLATMYTATMSTTT